ncbi:MAG: pirin-like C-terminal cupin domain-containing protein, partial [Sphingomonadales bacterium]
SVAAGRDRHHVDAGHTALFDAGDGPITLGGTEAALVLYVAGRPIGEPVVARGPFVMTTEGETRQAMLDYQSGRLGTL